MSAPNDGGGPAFPFDYSNFPLKTEGGETTHVRLVSTGLTIRDWFAGTALAAIIAVPDNHEVAFEYLADWAYKAADAMLAERAKEHP